MPPSPASSAKTASSTRRRSRSPTGLTVTTVLSIVGLVGAAIGAIGSLRAAFRALADKLTDDVFWIWVHRPQPHHRDRHRRGIRGIRGDHLLRERGHRRAHRVAGAVRRQPALGDRHACGVDRRRLRAGCRGHRGPVPHALGRQAVVARPAARRLLRRDRAHRAAAAVEPVRRGSGIQPAPHVVRVADRAAAVVQPVGAGHPDRRRLHHHERRRGAGPRARQVRRIDVRAAPRASAAELACDWPPRS